MLNARSGSTKLHFWGEELHFAIALKKLMGAVVHFDRYGFMQQDELGIRTTPNGAKIAWFKDPDGNILSVSEHL
jgi:hypothetical protein